MTTTELEQLQRNLKQAERAVRFVLDYDAHPDATVQTQVDTRRDELHSLLGTINKLYERASR